MARVRTRRKALERLIEIMEEKVDSKPAHVIIDHCDAIEDAEWLKDKISSHFDCVEIYIVDGSPIFGMYPGPGLVGPGFYAEL